jgi:hypothetical protein
MMQMHYEPARDEDIVHKIKAADPAIKVNLYRNSRAVYPREPEELELFRNNGWLLKNANGEEIASSTFGYYIVDKGNPDYQQWLANWLKQWIDTGGYDASYLDDVFGNDLVMYDTQGVNSGCDAWKVCKPINPRTGNVFTDAEWLVADRDIIRKVKQITGKPVYANLGPAWNGARFFDVPRHRAAAEALIPELDGFMSEAWMNQGQGWYTEDEWKKSVDFIAWVEGNVSRNKVVIPVGGQWYALPPDVIFDDFAPYCYASLLLAASPDRTCYLLLNSENTVLTNHCSPFLKEMFATDIGRPVGSYYIFENPEKTGRLYIRKFERAAVIVNPTLIDITVNIGEQSVTVPSHHSTILSVPFTPTAPTIFDRAWSTFEEFSGRLNLPVPPKPAQPPKLPIEE